MPINEPGTGPTNILWITQHFCSHFSKRKQASKKGPTPERERKEGKKEREKERNERK